MNRYGIACLAALAWTLASCSALTRQDVDFMVQGSVESLRPQMVGVAARTSFVLVEVADPEGWLDGEAREWVSLEFDETVHSPRLAPSMRLIPAAELRDLVEQLDPDGHGSVWERLGRSELRAAVQQTFGQRGAAPDYYLRAALRADVGTDDAAFWVLDVEARDARDWRPLRGLGLAGR